MPRKPLFDDTAVVDPWEAFNAAWAEDDQQTVGMDFRQWADLVPEPHGPLDLHRFRFQEALYAPRMVSDREAVLMKATQLGASSWAIRWALYWADMRGKTILYVVPTETFLTAFAQHRVREVLRKSEWLQSRIGDDSINNRGLRQIGLGYTYWRGSAEATNLESIPADGLILDEYDALEASNIGIAEQRVTGPLSEGLIRRVGVPSIPGYGISRQYEGTTQNVWMVKCACGDHQPMLGSDTYRDNVDEQSATLVCRKCRKPLDVSTGEWVATYPDRDILGYWMTKFILPGVDLRRVVANHAKTSPADRQTHFNRDLGEPYAPAEGRLSRSALLACTRPGEIHQEEGSVSFKPKTMGCCVPGTLVTMANGTTRPIEDVVVGDSVRTRRGGVASVTTAMVRSYVGPVYSASIYGQAQPLELTGEHPVWTERGWVQAADLRVGDRVLTPKFTGLFCGSPMLPVDTRTRPKFPARNAQMVALRGEGLLLRDIAGRYGISIAAVHSATSTRQRQGAEPALDLDALAATLGYYLAEGSVSRDSRRSTDQPTSVCWDFHPKERGLMTDLGNAVGRLGYKLSKPYVRERPPVGLSINGGQSCSVACGSSRLTRLLVSLGGRHSWAKRLAPEVLGWPVEVQRRMLMAYLNGDGCWRTPKPHIRRVEVGTASRELAEQMHAIAVRCGIRMGPPRRQHSPSAIKVGGRPKWVLQASFATENWHDGAWHPPRENGRAQIKSDGLWRRVDAIDDREYRGQVYNLDIDDDDTYLASYVAVHNCDVASSRACNVRISEHLDDYRKRSLWIGEIEAPEANDERWVGVMVDRLSELMGRYGVNMAAIDHLPETRLANAFAARFPGRVYLIAYNTAANSKNLWNVDDERRVATVHRTTAIDATLEAFRQQQNLIPDLDELPAEYADHLGSLIRVQERDDKDRVNVFYRSTGPDDYAMAEVYDTCAVELLHRARGMEQVIHAQNTLQPLVAPEDVATRLDDEPSGRLDEGFDKDPWE